MVDLNCDMGEGCGNDEAIMPFISSANIACGYHAGDEEMMRTTVLLAKKAGVAIGAHPSFPDRKNFGRTEMKLSTDELYEIIFHQLSTLKKITIDEDAVLHHVKPHGALYNMAARDSDLAAAIAKCIVQFDPGLILYGLSGSELIKQGKLLGLQTASEVFADRTYQDDGSLTPRQHPNALITDTNLSIRQVIQMIEQKKVSAVSGNYAPIQAETICIHGDGAHATEFAKAIYETLKKNGIEIKKP